MRGPVGVSGLQARMGRGDKVSRQNREKGPLEEQDWMGRRVKRKS